MWRRPFRRLVMMLVTIAFLGGASVQAMPVTGEGATAAASMTVGCADMGMAHDDGGPAPAKGMSPDCLKLMQCLGIPTGPVPAVAPEAPVAYGPIAYWATLARLSGVASSPTPFPPRQV